MEAAFSEGMLRRTGRYRHVVFADAINGAQRALDLAPVPADECDTPIDAGDNAFLAWLFQRGGVDVRNYRAETLARRLPACLRRLRVTNVSQARAVLQKNPQLVNDALSSILIGVTEFFRDQNVFDELAQHVLPALLTSKRRRGGSLRVWSVGCSNGAELYSVAMLLAELGAGLNIELPAIELLGTDCRIEATRFAAQGVYDLQALEGVSSQRLDRHFAPVPMPIDAHSRGQQSRGQQSGTQDKRWRIVAPLRAMTHWRTADALATAEPGPWDLVLCRNTAMYLKSSAASALWNRLSNTLSHGGYLLLGKAERPGGAAGLACIGQYLYRRTG